MARDICQMTITQPNASGVLYAYANIRISVYARGTTNLATIYQRPTGASQGPAPEAGATGVNPFVTGVSGGVEFWADGPVEYDLKIEDTQAPARVVTRTMGWNAAAVAAGSVPSSVLAVDGGLKLGSLGADILRQVAQIGEVIDWWRPNASVTVPAGFEICDGHQIPAGSHDFVGVAGAINVPDLRNVFILGADSTKAHATGANQGNTSADGPGIAGTGGSNAAKNFAHGHAVPGVDHRHLLPSHSHDGSSLYTGAHAHTGGSLYVYQHNRVFNPSYGSGEAAAFAESISNQGGGNTDAVGNIGVGGVVGYTGNYWSLGVENGAATLNTATGLTTWTLDPGTDVRPRFFGLLKLIKVRRS